MRKQTVGQRIKQRRIAMRMNVEDLAKASKLSSATIRSFENGERKPQVRTAQRLADALSLHLSKLLYGENTK